MILGGILAVYCLFGVLASSNRAIEIHIAMLIAIGVCFGITWLTNHMREHNWNYFWSEKLRFLLVIEVIGIIATFTWQPLTGWIFN